MRRVLRKCGIWISHGDEVPRSVVNSLAGVSFNEKIKLRSARVIINPNLLCRWYF